MPDEIDSALVPETAPHRGRPRQVPTVVVNVRLREDVYDAYCRRALRADVPVRRVLRHVLTRDLLQSR